MKIGQMASAMETGLPVEWKETLSQCQVYVIHHLLISRIRQLQFPFLKYQEY